MATNADSKNRIRWQIKENESKKKIGQMEASVSNVSQILLTTSMLHAQHGGHRNGDNEAVIA